MPAGRGFIQHQPGLLRRVFEQYLQGHGLAKFKCKGLRCRVMFYQHRLKGLVGYASGVMVELG